MKKILVALIGAYKYMLSPLLGGQCRFHPSCSDYAKQALERHGTAAALHLAARRILKCHPLNPGGIDPVP